MPDYPTENEQVAIQKLLHNKEFLKAALEASLEGVGRLDERLQDEGLQLDSKELADLLERLTTGTRTLTAKGLLDACECLCRGDEAHNPRKGRDTQDPAWDL